MSRDCDDDSDILDEWSALRVVLRRKGRKVQFVYAPRSEPVRRAEDVVGPTLERLLGAPSEGSHLIGSDAFWGERRRHDQNARVRGIQEVRET